MLAQARNVPDKNLPWWCLRLIFLSDNCRRTRFGKFWLCELDHHSIASLFRLLLFVLFILIGYCVHSNSASWSAKIYVKSVCFFFFRTHIYLLKQTVRYWNLRISCMTGRYRRSSSWSWCTSPYIARVSVGSWWTVWEARTCSPPVKKATFSSYISHNKSLMHFLNVYRRKHSISCSRLW